MSPPVASTSGCGCCRRRRASHPLQHTAAAALPCLPSPLVDATVAAASGGGARPAPDRGSQCGQGTAAAPHPPRSWVPLVGRTGAASAAFAAAIAAARASSPRPLSTRRREGRSMGPRRRRCRLAYPPSRHRRAPGAAVGSFLPPLPTRRRRRRRRWYSRHYRPHRWCGRSTVRHRGDLPLSPSDGHAGGAPGAGRRLGAAP